MKSSEKGIAKKAVTLGLSTRSFDCGTNEDGTCLVGKNTPPLSSTIQFIISAVAFLFGVEYFLRAVFAQFQHVHPIMEVELSRQILARHIGVDTLSCAVVAWLGIKNRHLCKDLWDNVLVKGSNSMPVAAFDKRMFDYHPAGQQILTFFCAYQIKNTIDTIVFNDGILFIVHHLFSLTTAWGALYPGTGHIYAVFFMGISEMSTCVLCLLANFDDEHGVVGLGDAFPVTKAVVGVVFVILFVICRCILWPYCSWYFVKDSLAALKSDHPMVSERRLWLKWFCFALSGLSVLQVLWLAEIYVIAQEEIGKFL